MAWLAATASAGAPFSHVVTTNVDHWCGWSGSRTCGRSTGQPASPGADVVTGLFENVIRADEPVVIIGSVDEEIAAIKARYGLSDFRWHQPPNPLRKNPEAIAAAAAFIAANSARFHFLCVGSPQQEMVAAAALGRGDAGGVALCCGASLEFLSGRVTRAPRWMRAAGLEWLFRLASQPRRLARRYLIEGSAIIRVWQAARHTNA